MLQRLTTGLWYAIVLLIVLLAVYSSFGRLLLNNLGQYREDILREVNARIDFVLEIDDIRGSWRSLSPSIEAKGVRILSGRQSEVGLSFDEITLELDVFDTLRTMSPRLYNLKASGGMVRVDLDANGKFSLAGLPSSGQVNLLQTLNDFVFNAESLEIAETAVHLQDPNTLRVSYIEGELQRSVDFRRLLMNLQAPDRHSSFRLAAEGRGELNDFENFEGLFHLQGAVGQLADYRDLLAMAGLDPTAGVLESDVWLRLDRGSIRLAARFKGEEIGLNPAVEGDSPIRIEHATLTAAAEYVEGRWEFRARDFNLSGSGEAVAIDRLVGSYGDNRLTLRMADLRLGELSNYLGRAGLLPDTAADVLGVLSPTGRLERVEFALDDLARVEDWRLAMNFTELDVEPWKGAPGLINAAGYADLQAFFGRVQLASSEFSMSFPTVFRQPLDYTSFSAELHWTLAEDAFRIRSGPFTAYAEEGEVRGLFAFQLPRVKVPEGSEMDLMVALKDTSPEYRSKYLPYKLNEKLLNWLEPSIGEGSIREGGFIYRGSLVRRPQHKTVQLFFDVEDTLIDYHKDWPELQELQGLVLIDDSNVDVYGHRARVLDSEVRDIRASIRSTPDKQMHLSLQASMQGSAADGLFIVNNSPLRSRVGDTFEEWTADGELETRLDLSMNLSDLAEPPVVDLQMELASTAVSLAGLNLSASDVAGSVSYQSATGFASERITGTVWGQPVTGRIRQGRSGTALADLDISFTGPVEAQSLREWLDLDLLRLAEGRTEAELHVIVPPAGGAYLEASSELGGVALDLPSPWAKTADQRRSVSLTMPLASGERRLQLSMDDEAWLTIDLEESGFSGGSLGFGEPLEPPGAGRFLLGGQTAYLDWDEWQGFIDRYLAVGEGGEVPVRTEIRDLEIARLKLFGQEVDDVLLGGQEQPAGWYFDFSTDWILGGVDIPDDLSLITIDLKSLDYDAAADQLARAEGDIGGDGEPLPPLAITISDLYQGENSWGNLSLRLRQEGPNWHFHEVRGNLRNLQLGGEEGLRLDWLRGEDGERSHLVGTLGFLNFGDVLTEYQYEEIVETSSGRIEVDLGWAGSPADYGLRTMTGRMGVDVADGRFLKTSGATEGTLRVVGILNLAEFVRRLSLDLSHVYKAGVPFDSIQGELIFQEGLIEVPMMDVKGRTSRFQFVGVADARDATVEGELVATLPIASNLPWMFALVSGLPAAAGVYVISKLFNKQMDRFSSAVYGVSGPWVDPQVDFERIFDDSANEKIIQTAENAETPETPDKPPDPET